MTRKLIDLSADTCPKCGYDMDLYSDKGVGILSCCMCEYEYNIEDKGDYLCAICGKWFNYNPEKEPHSTPDGEDCHEQCCPDCQEEERGHRGRNPNEYCAKCGGTCQYDSDGKLLTKAS